MGWYSRPVQRFQCSFPTFSKSFTPSSIALVNRLNWSHFCSLKITENTSEFSSSGSQRSRGDLQDLHFNEVQVRHSLRLDRREDHHTNRLVFFCSPLARLPVLKPTILIKNCWVSTKKKVVLWNVARYLSRKQIQKAVLWYFNIYYGTRYLSYLGYSHETTETLLQKRFGNIKNYYIPKSIILTWE